MARVFLMPVLALVLLIATPLRAGSDLERLFDAIEMDQLIALMRDEGLAYGDSLADEMLPGGADPTWQALVDRIYDTEKMTQVVHGHFSASFGDADTAPLLAFFQSEPGKALISAELETRAAFMSPGVEEGARHIWREADKTSARQELIADYVAANDLLDYNVAGAMNANYQFFLGLVEGGAIDMTEEEILTDVWAQEAETRNDTREWLFAYLTMAYDDLPDQTIADYTALSRTPAGRALNRALFAGFDRMYADLSLSLGLAIASRMGTGEEL